MPNQHTRRTPKRPKSQATASVNRLHDELKEAHETIAMQANQLADAQTILNRKDDEIEELVSRLDEMHEILARKNTVIRFLAMGDLTASEFGLSDVKGVAHLPQKRA